MSAEAFRRVLNKIPQIKEWQTSQRGVSGVTFQTRRSSQAEVEASRVDFRLPLNQLTSVIGNADTARAIFASVQTGKYTSEFANAPGSIEYGTSGTEQYIIFKSVRFGNLNKEIADYLQQIAIDSGQQVENLSQNIQSVIRERKYDKGHVYGWANTLVERTRADITQVLRDPSRQVPPEQLQRELTALNDYIDSLINILEEYDAVNSEIEDIRSPVYARYRKTDRRWLIQWQAAAEQQKSGSKVGAAIGLSANTGVRGFLNNFTSGSDTLVKNVLEGMIKGFIKQGIASEGSNNLAQLQTSPTLLEMIEDSLLAAATGTKKKLKESYAGVLDKLAIIPVRKVFNKQEAKSSASKAKSQLKQLKNKIAITKQAVAKQEKKSRGENLNLLSLTNLINAGLHERLRANMGTGNRRDVLNYRSGRFASNVSVDHLTLSRQGMITAFYTYMKYPYATFSAGGRQQNPKSRDPKLLISKSIRELAAQQVKNQLRAVLI